MTAEKPLSPSSRGGGNIFLSTTSGDSHSLCANPCSGWSSEHETSSFGGPNVVAEAKTVTASIKSVHGHSEALGAAASTTTTTNNATTIGVEPGISGKRRTAAAAAAAARRKRRRVVRQKRGGVGPKKNTNHHHLHIPRDNGNSNSEAKSPLKQQHQHQHQAQGNKNPNDRSNNYRRQRLSPRIATTAAHCSPASGAMACFPGMRQNATTAPPGIPTMVTPVKAAFVATASTANTQTFAALPPMTTLTVTVTPPPMIMTATLRPTTTPSTITPTTKMMTTISSSEHQPYYRHRKGVVLLQPTVQGVREIARRWAGQQAAAIPTECTYELSCAVSTYRRVLTAESNGTCEPSSSTPFYPTLRRLFSRSSRRSGARPEQQLERPETVGVRHSQPQSECLQSPMAAAVATAAALVGPAFLSLPTTTTTAVVVTPPTASRSLFAKATSDRNGFMDSNIAFYPLPPPYMYVTLSASSPSLPQSQSGGAGGGTRKSPLQLQPDGLPQVLRQAVLKPRHYALRNGCSGGSVDADRDDNNRAVCFSETWHVLKRLADRLWPGAVVFHVALPSSPTSTSDDNAIGRDDGVLDRLAHRRNGHAYVSLRCSSHPLAVRLCQEYRDAEEKRSSGNGNEDGFLVGLPLCENSDRGEEDGFATTAYQAAESLASASGNSNEEGRDRSEDHCFCVFNGEEQRELFHVPTCEHGQPPPISLWICSPRRTVTIAGSASAGSGSPQPPLTAAGILQALRSQKRQSRQHQLPACAAARQLRERVIRAVLCKWKVLDETSSTTRTTIKTI